MSPPFAPHKAQLTYLNLVQKWCAACAWEVPISDASAKLMSCPLNLSTYTKYEYEPGTKLPPFGRFTMDPRTDRRPNEMHSLFGIMFYHHNHLMPLAASSSSSSSPESTLPSSLRRDVRPQSSTLKATEKIIIVLSFSRRLMRERAIYTVILMEAI